MNFFLLLLPLLIISCSQNTATKSINKKIYLENTKQLTFVGDNGEAYFSSDNKKLIFQSKRDGNECDKIYTMTAEGDNIRIIPYSEGAFTCSYYSIDDKNIFFSSTMQDGPECPEVYKDPNPRKYIWPLRNYDIYKLSNSNILKNLSLSEGYDAEATVHPYEKKIIFTSLRNGDIDLYEMDYDGKNLKRITNRFGYDGGAFYSPNGEKIVWRAWYPDSDEDRAKWINNLKNNYIESVPLDIYIADRDGSNQKRLTNNGATNWSPSWHPNGKYIVFSSNMDNWIEELNSYGPNFELYMMEISSGDLYRLTYNKTFDSFPVFSSDGRKLVYSSNRNANNPRQTNIFISDIKVN
jgi:Tol biopolymer transport system component